MRPLLVSLIVLVSSGFAQQPQPQQPTPAPATPQQSFSPSPDIASELQKTLALVTVPIRIFCDQSQIATATGFFYGTADRSQLFLITNRHVVIQEPQPGQSEPRLYPDHLVLRLHTNDKDLKQSEDLSVPLYANKQKLWREIDPSIDVVAIDVKSIVTAPKYDIGLFARENLLPSDIAVSIGDALVIIGYPLGLSDTLFNLPIAREGTVASTFPVPFLGKRFFLVDAKLHPGTSGSPVITRPSQFFLKGGVPKFATKDGVTYLVGINSGSLGDLNLNSVWFADIILELTK
jgi:S1-C subfamily serine protease